MRSKDKKLAKSFCFNLHQGWLAVANRKHGTLKETPQVFKNALKSAMYITFLCNLRTL